MGCGNSNSIDVKESTKINQIDNGNKINIENKTESKPN